MTTPWSPPPAGEPPGDAATGHVTTAHTTATAPSPSGGALPGSPAAPPPDAGPTRSDDVDWRRLHKVTPFLNAWKAGAVVVGVIAYNLGDDIAQLPLAAALRVLAVVGLVLLGAVAGLVYSAIAWRRTRYGLDDESVFLHQGVLWRQQRHVRLDRLQAVDVTQPLLARIFGFASLKIESAGGAGSNLTLSYLTEAEAQRLRNEILARAAGVRTPVAPASTAGAAPAPGAAAPGAPQAPEQQLLELTAGRLVGSLALSIGMIAGVLVLLGVVAVIVVTGNVSFVAGMLPALLGVGGYVWSRFAGEFAFRVAMSPDGIRLRHGLLESKARTVPPGRVQAVQVSQGPLWRGRRWWRVSINVAGYGPEEQTAGVLYPVATTEEVARLLPLVLPDIGTARPLEVLAAGMEGSGEAEGFVTSPRRARLFDPLVWRRNGVLVTGTAVLLRTGRLWRRLVLVPHERTQSLSLVQGPWDRRRRLAGIQLHSTPGQVTPQLQHLDVDDARTFLLEQAARAREARRHAGPELWMRPNPDGAEHQEPAALRTAYAGVLPAVVRHGDGGVPPEAPAPEASWQDQVPSGGTAPDAPRHDRAPSDGSTPAASAPDQARADT